MEEKTQGGLTQHVKPPCVYFNKSARYPSFLCKHYFLPQPHKISAANRNLKSIIIKLLAFQQFRAKIINAIHTFCAYR